jgi:F0F1-type ATP synthase epsilon subunit
MSLSKSDVDLIRTALDAARICLKNRDQSSREMQALEALKLALARLNDAIGSP